MYYDIKQKVFVSGMEMRERGIPTDDTAMLAEYGFYLVEIQTPPNYDPETQGIEPEGEPEPSETMPDLYIQKMRVINLLETFQKEKLAELAAIRWERQTQGIYFDGLGLLTSPDDQDRLVTTIQSMEMGYLTSTDFKTANGWIRVTLDKLKAMSGAIGRYVQGCYMQERLLSEMIKSCQSISALNDIDLQAGWPDRGTPIEENQEEDK